MYGDYREKKSLKICDLVLCEAWKLNWLLLCPHTSTDSCSKLQVKQALGVLAKLFSFWNH